jgi:homocysteine S-methyltransferase
MTNTSDRPMILDGGLSTQIQRHQGDISGPLWSAKALLDTPQLVQQAHRDFVLAGSEVLITASYQVSREGFVSAGLTAKEADLALETSVLLAREASQGSATLVAASVGPYGAILHDGSEYRGNYGLSQEYLESFHRARVEVLASCEPDFFAVETIPDVTEAQALAVVLADFPDIPAWFSFTASDDAHLPSGETIEEAVLAVSAVPGLYAVGVNCVAPEHVGGLIQRIRAVSDTPLIVYPNAGGVWSASAETWLGEHTPDLPGWFSQWSGVGLKIVGGCCGVDAAEIQNLARAIQS